MVTKALYWKALFISKLIKENKHLVIPHPGQSSPVISLNIQGIPILKVI